MAHCHAWINPIKLINHKPKLRWDHASLRYIIQVPGYGDPSFIARQVFLALKRHEICLLIPDEYSPDGAKSVISITSTTLELLKEKNKNRPAYIELYRRLSGERWFEPCHDEDVMGWLELKIHRLKRALRKHHLIG